MSFIFAILPLTIMIGLVILIAVIVKKNAIFQVKQANGKLMKWLLGGYISILVIATIVFYLLPQDKMVAFDNQDVEEMELLTQSLYNRAHVGLLDQVDASLVQEELQFDITEPTLHVTSDADEINSISVFVERKDSNDGTIEVIKYGTEGIVGRVGYQVDFAGDTLTIIQGRHFEFEFAAFMNEFTITQFKGDERFHIPLDALGTEIFLLKVPEDLELTSDFELIREIE